MKVYLPMQLNKNSFTQGLNVSDTHKMLQFLSLFPHGANKYDLNTKREIVSMSNNLARFLLVGDKVYVLTSLRFFDRGEVIELEQELMSLSELFQFKLTHNSEYPSWKPVAESHLLNLVKSVYQKEFSAKAHVTAIHAGLECGILRDKIGPIDVVSFGPTIKGAHSPDEAVSIETVGHFWKLFKAVLKE